MELSVATVKGNALVFHASTYPAEDGVLERSKQCQLAQLEVCEVSLQELAASQLEAHPLCDAAESAQQDISAQLSGADARAVRASAATEAAQHTEQLLRGELQAAQSNLATAEKQSSKKGMALAVANAKYEDRWKQLAAVEQELHAMRSPQVNASDLQGVAIQTI